MLTYYQGTLTRSAQEFNLKHELQNNIINTLRPREYDHYFEDMLKCIFSYEDLWISNEISLK